jgi:hypothetical protein
VHIQQAKLEVDGELFQYGEQLKETGVEPTGELAEENLSKGEAEQHLSDETAEEESTTRWLVSAIGDEKNKGN